MLVRGKQYETAQMYNVRFRRWNNPDHDFCLERTTDDPEYHAAEKRHNQPNAVRASLARFATDDRLPLPG